MLHRNVFIYEKVLSLCRGMVFKAEVIFLILEMKPHSDRRVYNIAVLNLQVEKQSKNVYKIRVGLSEPN